VSKISRGSNLINYRNELTILILTEEGFGSNLLASSVLGLPEVGFEMFSKDHRLGNVVLVSTARDRLVPVSLLVQESATATLEASLKPEGSSPALVYLFSGGSFHCSREAMSFSSNDVNLKAVPELL